MEKDTCGAITSRRNLKFNEMSNETEPHGSSNAVDLSIVHPLSNTKEIIPKIDMEFDTEDAAYDFYNEYAKATGFSIRRHTVHTDNNGRILDRVFCCECQGLRQKDKREVTYKSKRPITRTNCCAMMKINGRYGAKYKVVCFVAEHKGHALVSPRKAHMLKSHRKITQVQASQADDLDSSGIAPRASFTLISKQMGGRENVGFIYEDYKNYLHSKRTKQMKSGDTGGVLEYLQKRQLEDPNFFYAIQVDEDDLIANILWIDAQMKIDYACFGDVISFDTTHKKNKDGRPFSLFVGVNHHRQTTIFGAALLYDETASTFIWLFDTFATAMSGKVPQTILTDQDAAMAKALSTQWPGTCHRLCIWHIYQNAATHLSNVFAKFPSFIKDFKSCIYDHEEEEEFLNAWHQMLEKYELQANEWLGRLFNIREKWALVYGRQSFCADMTTTQRSESMHSVLKRYVNYKNNLLQFFNHFDRLVNDRRYEESKADFRTTRSTPAITFPIQILKHASNIYTHEIFELFQDELHKGYDAKVEMCGETEETFEYEITIPGKRHSHKVMFHLSQGKVSCSCKKFEFGGILCCHILKVFCLRNIMEIPQLYIKKRWTKRAKKDIVGLNESPMAIGGSLDVTNENDEKKLIGLHYKELCRLSNILTTRAVFTTKDFGIARDGLLRLIEEVDASFDGPSSISPTLGIKSVAQKASLSKVAMKCPSTFEVCGSNKDVQASGIMVRGWKKKEKNPITSGKRVKSSLEKTQRKKKHTTIGVQTENNNKDCEVGVNNLSLIYPSQGCSSSYVESLQYPRIFNQNTNQHTAPYYSSEGPQSGMSLSQLLQQQLIRPYAFDLHNYNPVGEHEKGNNEQDDAPRE